jgi:hypothetical protein
MMLRYPPVAYVNTKINGNWSLGKWDTDIHTYTNFLPLREVEGIAFPEMSYQVPLFL